VLSYRDIWIAARGELSMQIDKPSFEAFFTSAKALSYHDSTLTLQLRSILARDMAEKHYKHDVEAALANDRQRCGVLSEQQPLHQVDLG
jgi:chromosomal replication initiation ATPase DnaA